MLKDSQIHYTPLGILAYDSKASTLLNHKSGDIKWDIRSPNQIIHFVSVLDTGIFRVVSGKKSSSGFSVQVLHQKTGKIRWSVPLKKAIVSPLILENKSLVFITDDKIISLFPFKTFYFKASRVADICKTTGYDPLPVRYCIHCQGNGRNSGVCFAVREKIVETIGF
ncbi:MAG: hypothetical protein KAH62_00325 [Desulfobacula sp.]|nr:hypothetical protein [Desulfobacula sp.]